MARIRWAMGRGAGMACALALLAASACAPADAQLPPDARLLPLLERPASDPGSAVRPEIAPVPLPAEITPASGSFRVDASTALRVPQGDAEATQAAMYFADLLARSRGIKLSPPVTAGVGAGGISFEREPGYAPEGYSLTATPGGVRISATTGAGLFYGAVTLWQLLPPGSGAAQVAAQTIRDAPVYAWRGLLLDSARHFQSVEFVKSMLDWMAWHKLNVLHWHLTDDQGWRIEIKKYPRLTSVGGCRVPAFAGSKPPPQYCGFYTQSQIKDVVAHAAKRHIQVIPEIDMPGHAQAAVAAYPELSSISGPPPPVSARWGVHPWLFNVEPATLHFLEDVLQEVMALFPGSYVHIGGDEAVKDQWKASASVQARMQALGISDPEVLQTWFTQEIGRFLVAHGRQVVGWDEILQSGLPTHAIVMSWHGVAGAHAAAIAGNDTVLSPWPTLYFDNQQGATTSEPPGRLRVISLEDVYKFEPRDATLTADQQKLVLGVQANIWTEHIRTEDRVQWMALPRAAALAEVGWTAPERRNWSGFVQRLPAMFERYRAFGIHAADSLFAVDGKVARADKEIQVTFANQGGVGDIRYTVDGHDPSAKSARYSGPLSVPAGKELRAATFVGDQRVSQVWGRVLDPASLAKRTSRELDLCGDAISLLLEPNGYGAGERPIFALDIMNPCWIYRGVDLTRGAKLVASVGKLPFNFEIGEAAQKIRVGDANGAEGELEVRIDGCEGSPVATQELTAVPDNAWTKTLPQIELPPRAGRHDVCLRFARPKLDPMWALDWVRIAP